MIDGRPAAFFTPFSAFTILRKTFFREALHGKTGENRLKGQGAVPARRSRAQDTTSFLHP
jgi:hypothetical protein